MFPFGVLHVQCKNCNPNKHLEKKDENSNKIILPSGNSPSNYDIHIE